MNQEKPKVTVITVTYNAAVYIEQTIKSVAEQNYPNLEYIIIDGGSNDGTVDIIKKYQQFVTYWISEPDKGIYDAMNKGIDQATGKWINFMNAGDSFFEKGTVKKVIESTNIDVALIGGDAYLIDGDYKRYDHREGLSAIFNGMPCSHQTLFTSTAIMKNYQFDLNFRISADYDFVLKCHIHGYKFKFLDFPIANYLLGGISDTNGIMARIEDMFIQSRYLTNIAEIYQLHSYARFESYKGSNNRLLVKLLNDLNIEMEKLGLNKKKFALYGYGHVGQMVYVKYKDNIISIFDKDYKKLNEQYGMNIQDISQLKSVQSDFILITVLGREKEIEKYLIDEIGFEKAKIMIFTI